MAVCSRCSKSGLMLRTTKLKDKEYCESCLVVEFERLSKFHEQWVVVPNAIAEAEKIIKKAAEEADKSIRNAQEEAASTKSSSEKQAQQVLEEAEKSASEMIALAKLEVEKADALVSERKKDADLTIAATEQTLAALFSSAAKGFKYQSQVTAAKATKPPANKKSTGGLTYSSIGLPTLRKISEDGTYVVLDLETTGLSSRTHRITEVGALKVLNGVVIDQFSTLVNPQRDIPAEVQEITGITNVMVVDAPTIDIVLPKLLSFIEDAPIVAHNASFDLGFLDEEMKRIGITANLRYADTLSLARRRFPGYSSYSLGVLAIELALDAGTAHRALGDCETVYSLVDEIISRE